MLSLQGATWDKDSEELNSTTNNTNNNNNNIILESKEGMDSFSSFESMVDMEGGGSGGCYVTGNSTNNNINIQSHQLYHQDGLKELAFPSNLGDPDGLLLPQVDSTSSCSPNSSVFHNLGEPCNNQVHHFFMQPNNKQPNLASLLNVVPTNPLEHGFDLGEFGFIDNQVGVGVGVGMGVGAVTTMNGSNLLGKGCGVLGNFTDLSSNNQMGSVGLCSDQQFLGTRMFQLPENGPGFGGFMGFDENFGGIPLLNRSKLLRPLESFPSLGAQPTLFQKRAALRKNLANNEGSSGALNVDLGNRDLTHFSEDNEKKRKWVDQDDFLDDVSIDCSRLNYDSDDFTENQKMEEVGKNGGNDSNANSAVTGGCGDQKGKKKGLPAKNLMAERRRRKKLNDRLYMLRSVVPKISKMDRASILGDAIEYLKELLQRINDLHNELESTPPGSSSTPTTSFHPPTPTPSALPSGIMDKLCPSSLPSPNGQPPRVEVRQREGRAVNIHLFCNRRPGLLLSTMRALDNLGLDVQQAVISCFNGFAMDIFRAEQCQEGQDIHPEQIKAVLLETAGLHGIL